MSLSATDPINWNDGRLISLSAGQTAKCENLVNGQLYAILIYNSSQTDVNAAVTVVWSNSVPPSTVTVRGSTGDGVSANFVFVSGTDTEFVSISLGPSSAASVTAFVVSVSMPSNTQGLNNAELENDGQFHPFAKYDRYYTDSYSGWRSVSIESRVTQFICLQIVQSSAIVIVVNLGSGLADGQVKILGPTAAQAGTVNIQTVSYQAYDAYIPANGGTCVWMNADNAQNSQDAQIALQMLSAAEEMMLNVPSVNEL